MNCVKLIVEAEMLASSLSYDKITVYDHKRLLYDLVACLRSVDVSIAKITMTGKTKGKAVVNGRGRVRLLSRKEELVHSVFGGMPDSVQEWFYNHEDVQQLIARACQVAAEFPIRPSEEEEKIQRLLIALTDEVNKRTIRVHRKIDGVLLFNGFGTSRFMTRKERLAYWLARFIPQLI